ncbi:MAG: Fe-Mn family superoxide dismutase [Candidatus Paceibacterota bacterium]
MSMTYEEQRFDLPETFQGKLSRESVDEHLTLYSGYVKHTNLILEQIEALRDDDADANGYQIGELRRRLGFEFDGMRNHEHYFASLAGGPVALSDEALKQQIEAQWGSYDNWFDEFKQMAKTRGVGWANLTHDPASGQLLNYWNDEQHLGHLTGTRPVLMLDMWEHSFVYDYKPSGKGEYIDDFFANLNWAIPEQTFAEAHGQ